jgi:hypothetical protein
MSNSIVLEKLNKIKLSLFFDELDSTGRDIDNYKFSYLPKSEQAKIIEEYQNGQTHWFKFILLGFWRYITATYLSTVGTLKDSELIVNNIEEDINDLIHAVHKCLMKNDLQNPLGKQIHTNIKYLCLTARTIHQFGYKATKNQKEETIKKNMNIKRCTICVDDYLEDVYFDPTEQIINEITKKDLYPFLDDVLNELTCCKDNPQTRKIILMWIYGIIFNCGYEYKYIGKQFGVTREWVRIIIIKFRTEMNETSIGAKFFDKIQDLSS